ncbi:MAG TPA: EVE domain-containing protein [Pirellulales bacterium]|jgi:predicted RNA-binding protein with PUA-like domain
MPRSTHFWLFKTEPESFSIQDLAAAPKQTAFWDGVRNYQARNFLRDDIKEGDRVLFYHSNADPTAVVGTAIVVRDGYPDHTAWQKTNHHFDPKSTAEKPIWYMVDIQFEEIFAEPQSLDSLRTVSALAKMELLRRGSRLSVQPVSKREFETIVKLGHGAGRRK